jgi:hypothetical protein
MTTWRGSRGAEANAVKPTASMTKMMVNRVLILNSLKVPYTIQTVDAPMKNRKSTFTFPVFSG